MRILFAVGIPFPEGRANTRRIRTIAAALAAEGHTVTLLLPFARHCTAPVISFEGYRVEWCEVPPDDKAIFTANRRVRLSVQIRSRLKWLWRVLMYSLNRVTYDWLYLYQPALDGVMAASLARLCGRRVVSEYVDILSPAEYRSPLMKLIFKTLELADVVVPKLSHLILVISTVLEARYRALAPHSVVQILPTLVDGNAFQGGDPQRYRRELNLPTAPLLVYTGSFTKPQGVKNLLCAMVAVTRAYPDVRLLIAGGAVGVDHDDVPTLLAKYQLTQVVIYLGHLPQRDIIDLQAAADVFIMPKLDDPINNAGLSTKLAEYLASGKPVVASRVGDVLRYLQHDVNALLCQAGDVDDLTRCILRLLDDQSLAARLGRAGRTGGDGTV